MNGKNRKVSKARITNLANEKKPFNVELRIGLPSYMWAAHFNKIRKSNKDFVFEKL